MSFKSWFDLRPNFAGLDLILKNWGLDLIWSQKFEDLIWFLFQITLWFDQIISTISTKKSKGVPFEFWPKINDFDQQSSKTQRFPQKIEQKSTISTKNQRFGPKINDLWPPFDLIVIWFDLPNQIKIWFEAEFCRPWFDLRPQFASLDLIWFQNFGWMIWFDLIFAHPWNCLTTLYFWRCGFYCWPHIRLWDIINVVLRCKQTSWTSHKIPRPIFANKRTTFYQ